jgi:AcrR family transcriptional regulator
MVESAATEHADVAASGLREQKMLRTASRLTAVTRRLTAERGLGGFTIDEACEEVGISRRTFFNYFPTKEDAVIGADPSDEAEQFAEQFLDRGSRGGTAALDDLVAIVSAHFHSVDHDATEHEQFMRVLEREPRILARFIGITRERERAAAELIALREGVAHDDPRAAALVGLFSLILRAAGEYLIDPTDPRDYPQILTDTLAVYRDVMRPESSSRKP